MGKFVGKFMVIRTPEQKIKGKEMWMYTKYAGENAFGVGNSSRFFGVR
jgi:hypothetical protein